MTYFGVLITFILLPLLLLLVVVPRDLWRWLFRREGKVDWLPYLAILAHVAMALIYTTPWDNYLVATGVWWYDPALVTGLRLGWVPIEEYTFFVVQTLLTGLWALALMRTWFKDPPLVKSRPGLRLASSLVVLLLWMISRSAFPNSGTFLTISPGVLNLPISSRIFCWKYFTIPGELFFLTSIPRAFISPVLNIP